MKNGPEGPFSFAFQFRYQPSANSISPLANHSPFSGVSAEAGSSDSCRTG